MESYSYVNVYLVTLLQDSTSIEECRDTANGHPYIIRWYDEDRQISMYKILAEQEI